MNLVKVMQYLYKHEINCRVECFWDGGWDVSLGDTMNGFKHTANFDNRELEKAGEWLLKIAKEEYPNCVWVKP